MKAIIENNSIVLRNFECEDERPVFYEICDEFKKKFKINRDIMGPSEDVFTFDYDGVNITLVYDIDYGILPIECTNENTAQRVLEIVSNKLNK